MPIIASKSLDLISKIFLIFCLLLLSACAIHPLPEDVTALNTVAIVTKIRCEVRDAIKQQAVYLLEHDDEADPKFIRRSVDIIKEQFGDWESIDRSKLSKRSRVLIDRYDGALVFLDFTFTMSEENNNNADINLLSTLTRGTDALNIKATHNRTRKNVRNFRTQDSFTGIFNAKLTCKGRSKNADYMYPVTGEIGVAEVIDTFLQINEMRTLTPGTPNDRLFADTLSFTTSVSGSLGPKINLNPIGKALSLSDASLSSTTTRTDLHEVIIGLSLPKDEIELADKEIKGGKNITRRRDNVGFQQSKQAQVDALNQFVNYQQTRSLLLNVTPIARPFTFSLF